MTLPLSTCTCGRPHRLFVRCVGEDDFTFMDRLQKAGVQRQVARAASKVLENDAGEQLHYGTVVFHYMQAWDALKYGFRSLLRGRCLACGARHLTPIRYTDPKTGENRGGCFNGYRETLRIGWRLWWFAGLHGDD